MAALTRGVARTWDSDRPIGCPSDSAPLISSNAAFFIAFRSKVFARPRFPATLAAESEENDEHEEDDDEDDLRS